MRTATLMCMLAMCAVTAHSAPAAAATRSRPARAHCGSIKHHVRTRHVIWIWLENTDYTKVMGNRQAPYTNRLATGCRLAVDYHGLTHPSLPNYIGATSGRISITTDCAPTACRSTARSLFSRVGSWREYQGGMTRPCQRRSTVSYEAQHNPAVYYTRLRASCATHDLPLRDFRIRKVRFSLVVPDAPTQDAVPLADAWLARWLPAHVFSKRAYRNGSTVVFLTWDESYARGNHVVMVKISRTSHGRITRRIDHHWLYRKTVELLHL